MSEMRGSVSVIGLGKLGLPMAYAYASHGYKVIGVDKSGAVIGGLRKGKINISETGLDELRVKVSKEIEFVDDHRIEYAIANTEMTFIIVPTPSLSNGEFSNKYINEALRRIGKALKRKDTFHIVVVTSTVMPGSCETIFKPLLERLSGKKNGVDFGLFYNPEFIALGSVIHDLTNPDVLLIGEEDINSPSGDRLVEVLTSICDNVPSIHRMSYCNAELSKLSLNVFVTTKITLANVFAEMCEHMPDGDVDAVTNFLGADSRIGHKYLKGGLGFAGECFPRDNRAFMALARKYGVKPNLQRATDSVNEYYGTRVAYNVDEYFHHQLEGVVVSILGVAFKPKTNVTTESPALLMATELLSRGAKVNLYDPALKSGEVRPLEDKTGLQYYDDMQSCIDDSNCVIIATPWDEFKMLTSKNFPNRIPLFDCWRILDKGELGGSVIYKELGRGGR